MDIFKQVSGLSITAPYKSVFNEIIQLSEEAKNVMLLIVLEGTKPAYFMVIIQTI